MSQYNAGRRRKAEAAFRSRVEEFGGTVLGEYVNSKVPVQVRCKEGHICNPCPNNVRRGQGICRACAGKDLAATEAAFRSRVEELGGTVLGEYVNAGTPVQVLCKEGHICNPCPNNVRQGSGICRACAGQDPAAAEAAFRARVEELGGTVLGEYANAGTPVQVRCKEGHICNPSPRSVRQGSGICRTCAGQVWDVFYIVAERDSQVVKFGITSGDPRPRITTHRRDGYTDVVRLWTGLPDGAARALETETKRALRGAGFEPYQGYEYFEGARAEGLIVRTADARFSAARSEHGMRA